MIRVMSIDIPQNLSHRHLMLPELSKLPLLSFYGDIHLVTGCVMLIKCIIGTVGFMWRFQYIIYLYDTLLSFIFCKIYCQAHKGELFAEKSQSSRQFFNDTLMGWFWVLQCDIWYPANSALNPNVI